MFTHSCVQHSAQALVTNRLVGRHKTPAGKGPFLSFIIIDPEQGAFGVIFPEVMIFSEGLVPRKISSLTEISPNSPREGPINDILYRKLKNSL